MTRWKIDANCYRSEHFPVALYRWVPRRALRLSGHWEHVESFKTREDARANHEAIEAKTTGLPIYL